MIFHPPPRVMKMKTKVKKCGLIKLKIFCTAKELGVAGLGETINKMKRQPSEWENIFENDVTGKGLLSNIQGFHEAHHIYVHIFIYYAQYIL